MKILIGPYTDYNKKTKKTTERKVSIRIDKYDIWSMDSTLAKIILPMLKQLKATKHGSPVVDDADVPEKLRSTQDKTPRKEYDTDKFFHRRWDWVMNEMIWAFTQINNDGGDSKFFTGKHDPYFVPVDKNNNVLGPPQKLGDKDKIKAPLYRMEKGPKDTFKIDRKGLDAHHARIKNGTMLFGKYYQGLWD